jgi:tetratricopeptide (TPR) repeat protein
MTRRKKKPKRRRRTTPSASPFPDIEGAVYVSEYEITFEPILDRDYKRLPKQVKEAIERLHDESQRRPREAIPQLLDLIESYPDVPLLYNYLSIAYSKSGQREKSEAVVQENYRRNPDYLFARLNYVEMCLARRDYEKAAEILDHKFDLKLLYPNRKRFHISEVVSFMGLVGMYFVEIGERDAAEKYYDVLQQIGPRYPVTRQLRNRLFPGLFTRLYLRLTGRS